MPRGSFDGRSLRERASSSAPTVSVVTPFYNSAEYLPECIESVLSQSFEDFEYILVDNASTDESLAVACSYARLDERCSVVHFSDFVDQVPNYNRALELADERARYCKIAQADDALLPNCLQEMVALADADQDITVVGAYTVLQDRVFLDGLDYYESVVDGVEVLRRYLQDGPYLFGSPTTHMYRMKDVKSGSPFFAEDILFEDADVVCRLLLGGKLGFVHQVLSFVRTSNESISTRREDFDIDALTRRVLLERYGRAVFDRERFRELRRRLYWRHHRVLGRASLLGHRKEFWDLHERRLREEGIDVDRWAKVLGAAIVVLRSLANLEDTARELLGWFENDQTAERAGRASRHPPGRSPGATRPGG